MHASWTEVCAVLSKSEEAKDLPSDSLRVFTVELSLPALKRVYSYILSLSLFATFVELSSTNAVLLRIMPVATP